MPRPVILAEQMTDPAAVALREHREDRAALLASVTASFRDDARVRAAWLWGSFGRNEADDLSDLDPWLIVTDEAVGEMEPLLRLYAQRSGSFLSGGEAPQNAPPGGGYFGSLHEGRHGPLHMDCYWQPQSSRAPVPEHAILLDRLGEPAGPPRSFQAAAPITLTPVEQRVEGGISFAWLMFSIAAKYLARDPASDMGLMLYPKPALEEAVKLLGQEAALLPLDWSVPEEPLEKVARLRGLVEKVGQAAAFAGSRGVPLSPRCAPCLFRYLEMVESILRHA